MMSKRKRLSGLDKYLIVSFAILIIYSIAEFVTSTITGISHDVLTVALYGAFGGECFLCALIKKYKLKGGIRHDAEIDE